MPPTVGCSVMVTVCHQTERPPKTKGDKWLSEPKPLFFSCCVCFLYTAHSVKSELMLGITFAICKAQNTLAMLLTTQDWLLGLSASWARLEWQSWVVTWNRLIWRGVVILHLNPPSPKACQCVVPRLRIGSHWDICLTSRSYVVISERFFYWVITENNDCWWNFCLMWHFSVNLQTCTCGIVWKLRVAFDSLQ